MKINGVTVDIHFNHIIWRRIEIAKKTKKKQQQLLRLMFWSAHLYLALDSSALGRMVDRLPANIWTNYTPGIFWDQSMPNPFHAAVSALLHGNNKKVFYPLSH